MIGCYLRVSTDKQAEKHGAAAQKLAIEEWIARHSAGEAATWFEDQGVSGATMKRPGWMRLQAEVRAKRVKTVVVYSLSRAGRTLIGLLNWMEEMRELGVRLVFLTEQLDTGTPMGRAMFAITAVFTQLERDLIAERTKAGMRAFAARGGKIGGSAGYVNRHGTNAGMLKVTDDQVRAVSHLPSHKAAVLLGVSASSVRRRRGRIVNGSTSRE